MSSNFFKSFMMSSIGKKTVMAKTGLALCGFLITHLIGNCLIFVGADQFNLYAHTLVSNPAIYIAEAILVILFLSHIFMAVKLVIENKVARPIGYAMKKATGGGATFASATMPYTGFIILIFLVTHIMHFKYGTNYSTVVDGVEMRDIFRTVIEYFSSPIWVVWYVVAMTTLGIHLSHGFQSAFQSLGFNHPKYTPIIKCVGILFSIFIAIGFSSLAIFCHFQGA
jgi:succinate dehydrogenase / fumarate reductase cytochrome b subunit